MNKIIVAFILTFFTFGLLAGIADGEGGMHVTRLTATIDATDETIPVQTTTGWTKTGLLEIDGEVIEYSNITATSFLSCDRGQDDTDAVGHAVNSKVYSDQAGVLNNALGFDIAKMTTDIGPTDIPMIPVNFVIKTMPRMIGWDFNFLKEGPMVYLRYLLWCFSLGFIISVSLTMLAAFGGLMQGVLKLLGR